MASLTKSDELCTPELPTTDLASLPNPNLASRLAAIVESSDDAIISKSLDGTILTWNRGAERIFGYTAAEVVGRKISLLVPPDRIDEVAGILEQVRAGRRVDHFETVRCRRDGSQIAISVTISPICDDHGKIIAASKVARDITAQKQFIETMKNALREKEVLLQEIHHRVKNNLQVIASLINMQLRSLDETSATKATARDALEECRARIQAIALIHTKLYQATDFACVPFSDYMEELARSVFEAAGVHRGHVDLEIDIGDVALPVDKAIPVGLILNELIINALKHAFVGRARGRIGIRMRRLGGTITVQVADDGVGLPPEISVHDAATTGLQLVSTLAEQLEASLLVGRGERGTSFEITFRDDVGGRPS